MQIHVGMTGHSSSPLTRHPLPFLLSPGPPPHPLPLPSLTPLRSLFPGRHLLRRSSLHLRRSSPLPLLRRGIELESGRRRPAGCGSSNRGRKRPAGSGSSNRGRKRPAPNGSSRRGWMRPAREATGGGGRRGWWAAAACSLVGRGTDRVWV